MLLWPFILHIYTQHKIGEACQGPTPNSLFIDYVASEIVNFLESQFLHL